MEEPTKEVTIEWKHICMQCGEEWYSELIEEQEPHVCKPKEENQQ